MRTPSKRSQRVAELIQRRLAELIQQEMKDPRLPAWVTVSAVEVSSDFSFAKVYFTTLKAAPEDVLKVLNTASPFLRSQLAKVLTLRIAPQLQFVHDESLDHGRHIQALINKANLDLDSNEE